MSAIYLHIPFCRTKCPYCNFTSFASRKHIDDYIDCLIKEISIRNNYFDNNEAINSIYFGGGTPSLLKVEQIDRILQAIDNNFNISDNCEITIELNPEDANFNYIFNLRKLGINRISIGVQSFDRNDLIFLGRRHTEYDSYHAIELAQENNFDNISVDLIIGLPSQTTKTLEKMINNIIRFNIPHISSYLLTIEEKSIFFQHIKQGEMADPIDDSWQSESFYLIRKLLTNYEYEHYEISNYAKLGYRSRHNSVYWQWKPYLGIGVSAHSFNISSRQWNTNSITKYIQSIKDKSFSPIIENLTTEMAYNDYILTHIRTIWGIDSEKLKNLFCNKLVLYFEEKAYKLLNLNLLSMKNNVWILSETGLIWADDITKELMI